MSQLIGYTNFNNRGNIYDIIVEGPTGSTGGITGATGISDDINLSNVDNLNGKVNVYGIQKTSSATAPRVVVGDGTTGHNFQYVDPHTEIDIDNHVISSTQDNGTYATFVTVENLPYPTIDLSTKDYDLDLETHVISKGGQAAIQYTTIGSGLIHSWEILNGEHFAREMDQGTYNHILYFNNTPGVDNGHIKHGPPVTTSVALIGNPIHQFVTGGDGNLDFRGMKSPLGTIVFNPTATDIEMEALGATGATGATGPQGPQGPPGPTGATGGPQFSVARILGTTLATGTTGSLGSVTIPANTLTASSQSFRFVTYGTMAGGAGGGGGNAIAFQINGTTVGTACSLVSNISSTGSYRMEVYLIAVSYAPAAVSYSCSIRFDYEQVLPLASTTSHTQSFLVSGINMGVPCTFGTYVTVMNPNTSISSNCAKCWLE